MIRSSVLRPLAILGVLSLLAVACDESTTDPVPPGSFEATFAFSPDSSFEGEAIFVGGTESGLTMNLTSDNNLVIRLSRGSFGNIGAYMIGTALGRFTGFVRLPVNGTIIEYTLTDGEIDVKSVTSRTVTADITAVATTSASGATRQSFTFTATVSANCQGVCLF